MELNTVHHLDNRIGIPQLPEKCANLIIADPPYFEVKGDFDFVWKSFDEYLEFMEGQAKLYKRILADNGTLFVWGHAKRIAYVQVIFDRYFNLENSIVWEKKDCQTRMYIQNFRSFAPVTERLLMYTHDTINLTGCVCNVRDYIREEIIKAKGKISFSEINAALGTATNGGGVASACLSLDKMEPAMISEPIYKSLQVWLGSQYLQKSYLELNSEYRVLRDNYEKTRRPFENLLMLTDVLKFEQETLNTRKFDHDTKKPEAVTRALILTCSRPNDLIVVPFAGSGTECAMAAKEGRRFVGFETTLKHVLMSNKRAAIEMSKPDLFRHAI
jgi:site-specific DNA-methyltransferase (adenine-specific)